MSPPLPTDPSSVTHGPTRTDDRLRAPVDADSAEQHVAGRGAVRLTTVQRVIEATSRAQTLAGALDALVAGLRDTLGSDTTSVMLVEESHDGAALVTHAARGIASEAASVARVPLGRGVIGQLAERG